MGTSGVGPLGCSGQIFSIVKLIHRESGSTYTENPYRPLKIAYSAFGDPNLCCNRVKRPKLHAKVESGYSSYRLHDSNFYLTDGE